MPFYLSAIISSKDGGPEQFFLGGSKLCSLLISKILSSKLVPNAQKNSPFLLNITKTQELLSSIEQTDLTKIGISLLDSMGTMRHLQLTDS